MTPSNLSLFLRKPFASKILIHLLTFKLKNNYGFKIGQDLDLNYCCISKSIKFLKSLGLIERKRIDIKIFISLTDKGRLVALELIKLKKILQ